MTEEFSYGGILFCYENGVRKYVLIMESNGNYGFPKGHQEEKETALDTAKREIWEETGIERVDFLPEFKKSIKYHIFPNIHKNVIFFVGKFDSVDLIPIDKTILSAQKYELNVALNLLKFKELRDILLEVDYILDIRGE